MKDQVQQPFKRFSLRVSRITFLLCICLNVSLFAADVAKKHPLTPAVKVAKRSLEEAQKVTAFTANFTKHEVVNGRLQPKSDMFMKWRAKPFSVYFKFINPNKGREVIYVEGKNNGNLLVHVTGIISFVGTLALSPTSDRVMAETRYPITNSGLVKMVEGVIKQWEKEMKYDETTVKYYKNAKLNGRPCRVIETSHSVKRKQFPFHMTRLYIDAKTILPLRVDQFGYPSRVGGTPPMIERYEYSNVNTNVDLKNIDFDKNNRAYGY